MHKWTGRFQATEVRNGLVPPPVLNLCGDLKQDWCLRFGKQEISPCHVMRHPHLPSTPHLSDFEAVYNITSATHECVQQRSNARKEIYKYILL